MTVPENTKNKMQTAEKGWPSNFGTGDQTNNPLHFFNMTVSVAEEHSTNNLLH
jgi:hypothetical protein